MLWGILLLAILFAELSASAQTGRDLYEKYAGRKGVESVYVAPFMMQLIGGLLGSVPGLDVPTEDGGSVDFGPVLKSMSGMFVLNATNDSVARQLSADISKATSAQDFLLLLESRSEDNLTRIYATLLPGYHSGPAGPAPVANSLVIYSIEPGETSFVSLDCIIPLPALQSLLSGR